MRFLLTIVFAIQAWAAVDPQLLALMPGDADMIAGMDVEQMRGTPFGQHLLNLLTPAGVARQWAGIQIDKDVSQLVVTMAGNAPLITASLEAKAKPVTPGKATSEDYRGFLLTTDQELGQGMVGVIVQRSLLVGGAKESVKAAIDRFLAKAQPAAAMLTEALRMSASGPFWTVSSAKTAATVFPGARSYSATLNTPKAGGVDVQMEVGFAAPQAAQDLANQLTARGGKATVEGSIVKISATMPEQQAEMLFVPR